MPLLLYRVSLFLLQLCFEAEAFGAPEVDFSHREYRAHEANPLHCLRRTEERYHAGGSDKDFTICVS